MPTQVTLYADTHADGALSFFPSPEALKLSFELADGYAVVERDGTCIIAGPAGTMTLDTALTVGILQNVALDLRIAKV